MALIETDMASFAEDVIASPVTAIVDIWAPWCGPCKALSPILDQLSDEYTENVTWMKLNADDNPDILQEFGVSSIPTILVFKDGDVVYSVVGAKAKSVLVKELESYL